MTSYTPSEMQLFESAMRRAFDLARRGPAADANPQVGCVIIDASGRIISEGWHMGAGTPHAETDAIYNLPADWAKRASELTAVVTLEPCNHTGHTGPCSDALVAAGIGRVVFALADPGPTSSGGADKLRAAGVEVLGGVLELEARMILSGWLAANAHKVSAEIDGPARPYVIAKWAQSLDGRAAAADGSSQWITGPEARAHVHSVRALVDAILVGTGTLLSDDPSLTARDSSGELLVPAERQPIPVIFGNSGVPRAARIRHHPALKANGLSEPLRIAPAYLKDELESFLQRGVKSIYLEGGPRTVSTWLREGLVDELHIYVAPMLLGGPRFSLKDLGIETLADSLQLSESGSIRLGEDWLVIAKPSQATTVKGNQN